MLIKYGSKVKLTLLHRLKMIKKLHNIRKIGIFKIISIHLLLFYNNVIIY